MEYNGMKLGTSIGDKLLEGYNSVYVVDTSKNKMEPYLCQNDISRGLEKSIGRGLDYEYVCHLFQEQYVVPEERQEFQWRTSLDNLKKEILFHGTFSYTFQRYNTNQEKEYVEMHAAKISPDNDSLLLMTFRTITDSIYQVHNRMVHSEAEFVQENTKRTILLVEDEELYCKIVTRMLEKKYHVLVAHNGREALEVLQEKYRSISLIMLDIQMPVMDGYGFLEEMKKNPMFIQIPVIVTAASNQTGEEQRCLKLGAADYITKPYNPELAMTRIHNVIHFRESALALSVVENDELTGLYTKQAFMHHANIVLQTNPDVEYTLIGIDIENYKLSNSQYGEKKCDEFLAYVGAQIQKVVVNGLTGRFGGDQFIIMIKSEDEPGQEMLNRIVKDILKDAPIPHQVAKIGVYGPVSRELALIACCDRAFWAIKKIKGIYKNDIAYYTDEMRAQLLEEQKIQECMEEALEQGQFVIYYQPKHDCMSRKIAGAEALVRWIHPEYGFMSPGKFIPLFEKNGFITKLDSYVIEKVCRDQKRWAENGPTPVPVSMNVSRRDYFEEGWIAKQLEVMNSFHLDPRLLHMEVTESVYTENAEHIRNQMQIVQNKGYQIEMDDFGAGYSSLGMLTDFPLDIIKLDISFVRKLEKNEVVIDTIIKLAHRMGFKTVAEGVETEKQYNTLRELGCDYIQGYYFSKPLPVEEFEKYLRENQQVSVKEEECDLIPSGWTNLNNELEIKNTLLECVNALSGNDLGRNKINQLLSIIARFYGGSRAYIFEFNKDRTKVSNTFEWCGKGIEPQIDQLQNLDIHLVDGWVHAFEEHNEFYLPSVAAIKDTEPDLYEVLAPQKIESLMTAPLLSDGEVVGFVGVDDPTLHTDTLVLIQSVTSFVQNDLERGRYIKRLENLNFIDSLSESDSQTPYYHDSLQINRSGKNTAPDFRFGRTGVDMGEALTEKLMQNLPGGFVIYKMAESAELIYLNSDMVQLLGYDNADEVRQRSNYCFRNLVIPEDRDVLKKDLAEMKKDFGCRMQRKDGSVVQVKCFGKRIYSEQYGDLCYAFVAECER